MEADGYYFIIFITFYLTQQEKNKIVGWSWNLGILKYSIMGQNNQKQS